MEPSFETLGMGLLAYTLGSVHGALWVAQIRGLPDPRTHGSQNPGATNMWRLGGIGAGLLTALWDILKGWLPVWSSLQLGFGAEACCEVGLCALLGHWYPFLRTGGGKGVATAFGVLWGLSWESAVICAVIWVLSLACTRYVSLASMLAAAAAPFGLYLRDSSGMVTGIFSGIALWILWKHRINFQRVLQGTEPRL